MTPALAKFASTLTPDWVMEAVQRYAVPKRFTISVAHWRATRFQVKVRGAHRIYAAKWYRAWSARNRAAGLTSLGKPRTNRQHPELRGLPWRQYHTAYVAKRRAEDKLFPDRMPREQLSSSPHARPVATVSA